MATIYTDDHRGVTDRMLQLQSADVLDLDREMRQHVGQKAGERVHNQRWAPCVEIGYVAPPGEVGY